MMTQEEFMDVMAMKRQGLSIKEIAEETGYHPSTISELAEKRRPTAERGEHRGAGDRRAAGRRGSPSCCAPAPRLLATSVFELIKAEGYERLLCERGPAPERRPRARGSAAAPALDADRDRTG